MITAEDIDRMVKVGKFRHRLKETSRVSITGGSESYISKQCGTLNDVGNKEIGTCSTQYPIPGKQKRLVAVDTNVNNPL